MLEEVEGLDRHPSANKGVLQTPHPGTRVPLLRAQSDHGHVLPPSPLWLAWKLCQPCFCPSPELGLTGDPLNSPTAMAVFLLCPPSGKRPPLGTQEPALPSPTPAPRSDVV